MVKTLVLVLDLTGTFVFALSGGMAAARHRLDLFGVMSLSLAAGTFGGVLRDLTIGSTPPAALADWRYIAACVAAGGLIFLFAPVVARLQSPVKVLDAGGLGLFAVSGATKAVAFGIGPVGVVMLGTVTAIGGGMVRDLLVLQIPYVLRGELYATIALLGATVVAAGHALEVSPTAAAVVGAGLATSLRLIAIKRNWHLPQPPPLPEAKTAPADEETSKRP